MALSLEVEEALRNFLRQSDFTETGAVVTDLDGTAVSEETGRIYIPPPVKFGLKALYEAGFPVVKSALNHGDISLKNVIVNDEREIRAILDWEH